MASLFYQQGIFLHMALTANLALVAIALGRGEDSAAASQDSPEKNSLSSIDLYGDPLPTGAVARLGTLRFRSDGELHAATYSADGANLIGIGSDAIYYWNADDGRLTAQIDVDVESIQHAAVSADRRSCCAVGFTFDEETRAPIYTVKVWDLEQRQLVRSINLPENVRPACLAMTADGSHVGFGTDRGQVSIYDAVSGAEVRSYAADQDEIIAVAFSTSDRRFLYSGRRLSLWIWNWESDTNPIAVPEVPGGSQALSFSRDGKYLAIVGDYLSMRRGGSKKSLQVLRTSDWSPVVSLDDSDVFKMIQSTAFSPDGRFLAISDYYRQSVALRDLATGKEIHEWPMRPEASGSLAFSADGEWLVCVSEYHGTPPRIWNTSTNEPRKLTIAGHRVAPSAVKFTRDGKTIATAGDDGTLRFWDPATGRELRMASHHPGYRPDRQYNVWIRAMALSDDGRFAATSSLDDSVRLWDAATAKQVFQLPGHGRLGGNRTLEFTPDGTKLASWGDDMFLRIWDTKTGKALAEHAIRPTGVDIPEDDFGVPRPAGPLDRSRMRITNGFLSPDGSRFLLGMLPDIYVFDAATGQQLCDFRDQESRFLASVAISSDNGWMASVGWGRRVQVKLPDGGVRSAPAEEQVVCVRQLSDGAELHQFSLPGKSAGPVAVSHDGKLLAASVRESGGPIRVYAMDSGEQVAEIKGFAGAPRALEFSYDGRLLASSLSNTTVLLWDWRQFQDR